MRLSSFRLHDCCISGLKRAFLTHLPYQMKSERTYPYNLYLVSGISLVTFYQLFQAYNKIH